MKKNLLFLFFLALLTIKNSVHAAKKESQDEGISTPHHSCITSLPNELIQKIMEHCETPTLLSIAQTNKKLENQAWRVLRKRFDTFDQKKFDDFKKLSPEEVKVFLELLNLFSWDHPIWTMITENDALFFVDHFKTISTENGSLPSWGHTSFWSKISEGLFQLLKHFKNHKQNIFYTLIPKEPLPCVSNKSFWENASEMLFKFLILLKDQPSLFNDTSLENPSFDTFWKYLGNLRPEINVHRVTDPKNSVNTAFERAFFLNQGFLRKRKFNENS